MSDHINNPNPEPRPTAYDSCPASANPRPSPSGTSGGISKKKTQGSKTSRRKRASTPRDDGGVLQDDFAVGVPDTPDAVSACRAAGVLVTDGGCESAGPETVGGVLRVGRMYDPRENFEHFENPDLRALFTGEEMPPDTIIEALDGAKISIIDADVHHWATPPTPRELMANLSAVRPPPAAAWVSHGHGLKLVYVGKYHETKALAAAFSLPTGFTVELLNHTRHPLAADTARPGAVCGPVVFAEASDTTAKFVFRGVGKLTPELREKALHSLGMRLGGRYDHDRCPLAPGADSDAVGCVVVYESGVFCYRCSGHGIRARDNLAAGFYPFGDRVGDATTELDSLAKHRVHWNHARHVLKHLYPNLHEDLLRRAYAVTLDELYGLFDPRVKNVFNTDLDFVYGIGVWLQASSFAPTKVDTDAANGLPYVQEIKEGKDGTLTIWIDGVRRSQVKNRTPAGYKSLQAYVGITFAEYADTIPVLCPPFPKHPIQLLDDPMPEDDAFAHLETEFPLVDRRYLRACIAAAICGEARIGQPPMLAVTGPAGSGKEQIARLAVSFLGQDIHKADLANDEESFMRGLGAALTMGRRFIVFDELSKTPNLSQKIKSILQISANIQWRALYQTMRISTPFRAAVIFPCTYFPDFLTQSAEFNRRVRHVQLYRKTPDWRKTSGADTREWRDRTPENARIANSILTHTWRLCHG